MNIIRKLVFIYQLNGLSGFLSVLLQRGFRKRANAYKLIEHAVSTGKGIEIGGASTIFQKNNLLPIYPKISCLDNCNFKTDTLWHSEQLEGGSYSYGSERSHGNQYIQDATKLDKIPSHTYSFLLSSHVLEHIANPIKALHEWLRVLKPDGYLILVIPHKDGTFDHKRPTTSLKHLIEDFQKNVGEDDLSHLPEILNLHDLSRDPQAGSYETFQHRSMDNFNNRSLHHHVFTTALVTELMHHMALDIQLIEPIKPMHIIVVARKRAQKENDADRGSGFSQTNSSYTSPFPSDR